MTPSTEPQLGKPLGQLHVGAKAVLIGWAVLIVVFAAYAFYSTRSGDGFEDLARFISLFLAAIALGAVGVVALVIRRFAVTPAAQTLAAVLAPPALVALAIGIIRVAG